MEMNLSKPQEAVTEREEIKNMAEMHKKTPAQIVLRWAVQQGLDSRANLAFVGRIGFRIVGLRQFRELSPN